MPSLFLTKMRRILGGFRHKRENGRETPAASIPPELIHPLAQVTALSAKDFERLLGVPVSAHRKSSSLGSEGDADDESQDAFVVAEKPIVQHNPASGSPDSSEQYTVTLRFTRQSAQTSTSSQSRCNIADAHFFENPIPSALSSRASTPTSSASATLRGSPGPAGAAVSTQTDSTPANPSTVAMARRRRGHTRSASTPDSSIFMLHPRSSEIRIPTGRNGASEALGQSGQSPSKSHGSGVSGSAFPIKRGRFLVQCGSMSAPVSEEEEDTDSSSSHSGPPGAQHVMASQQESFSLPSSPTRAHGVGRHVRSGSVHFATGGRPLIVTPAGRFTTISVRPAVPGPPDPPSARQLSPQPHSAHPSPQEIDQPLAGSRNMHRRQRSRFTILSEADSKLPATDAFQSQSFRPIWTS